MGGGMIWALGRRSKKVISGATEQIDDWRANNGRSLEVILVRLCKTISCFLGSLYYSSLQL